MKKIIKEFDEKGNLIKETIIEDEEEVYYIPYYPYGVGETYDNNPFWDDRITVKINADTGLEDFLKE